MTKGVGHHHQVSIEVFKALRMGSVLGLCLYRKQARDKPSQPDLDNSSLRVLFPGDSRSGQADNKNSQAHCPSTTARIGQICVSHLESVGWDFGWMLINMKGLTKEFPENLLPIRKLMFCVAHSSSLTCSY